MNVPQDIPMQGFPMPASLLNSPPSAPAPLDASIAAGGGVTPGADLANLQNLMPLPQSLATPNYGSPEAIAEQYTLAGQNDGTLLLHRKNYDGTTGPVVKIIKT